jgi:hypothetical protein
MSAQEEKNWLSNIAEVPVIGEVLMFLLMIVPVFVFHFVPVIGPAIGRLSDGMFCIVVAIVVIVWISVLEPALNVRFVFPVLRIRWLWIWIVFIIYGVLQLTHVVRNFSQVHK